MDRAQLQVSWFPIEGDDAPALTPAEVAECVRITVLARINGMTEDEFMDAEEWDWERGLEHLQ